MLRWEDIMGPTVSSVSKVLKTRFLAVMVNHCMVRVGSQVRAGENVRWGPD